MKSLLSFFYLNIFLFLFIYTHGFVNTCEVYITPDGNTNSSLVCGNQDSPCGTIEIALLQCINDSNISLYLNGSFDASIIGNSNITFSQNEITTLSIQPVNSSTIIFDFSNITNPISWIFITGDLADTINQTNIILNGIQFQNANYPFSSNNIPLVLDIESSNNTNNISSINILIENCNFINNTADFIYYFEGNNIISINNSNFSRNTIGISSISVTGESNLIIDSLLISENLGDSFLTLSNGAYTTSSNIQFLSNSLIGDNSIIQLNNTSLINENDFSNITFSNNEISDQGQLISTTIFSIVSISNSQFISNKGICLLLNSNGTFKINNSNFIGNVNSQNQSSLIIVSSPTTITFNDCTFNNNNYNLEGSIVSISSNSNQNLIQNCSFTNNYAQSGTIYLNNVTDSSIIDSIFKDNIALSGNSGSILCINSRVSTDYLSLINNTATNNGKSLNLSNKCGIDNSNNCILTNSNLICQGVDESSEENKNSSNSSSQESPKNKSLAKKIIIGVVVPLGSFTLIAIIANIIYHNKNRLHKENEPLLEK